MCKYLTKLGFNAYDFGKYPDGDVDVEAGDFTVCEKVSPEAAAQISKFLIELESRVEQYINNHYNGNFPDRN